MSDFMAMIINLSLFLWLNVAFSVLSTIRWPLAWLHNLSLGTEKEQQIREESLDSLNKYCQLSDKFEEYYFTCMYQNFNESSSLNSVSLILSPSALNCLLMMNLS